MALPVTDLFSKYDAPGRYVIGTPRHAVFFAADMPYQIGFPGAVGDRALILRFGEGFATDQRKSGGLESCGLLPADAVMLRKLLWARLQRSTPIRAC